MSARILQSTDEEHDLTTVTVLGDVSAGQVRTQIITFLTTRPTRLVLWDIRNGTLSRLSSDDLRELVASGAPYADRRRGGRTAILCSKPVDFGISRMFGTFANIYHIPFEIHVFDEYEDAMSWLLASA